MRVLLIEDDPSIGAAVRDHIAAQGYGVDWAETMESARDHLAVADYQLILLDLTLPDGNGIDLLREIRGGGSHAAVLITSARDQIAARIEGLNAGADDYLVKPFDLAELTARATAVARRYNGRPVSERRFGDITVDAGNRRVLRAGEPVDLTAREWAVLERLTQTRNATVSKSDIEESLYAFGAEVESNTVEVYVSRLRKKLGKDFLRTIRGIGYTVPAGPG